MAAAPLNKMLGIDFTKTHTTQKHELGIRIPANDGRTYMYCKAGAAIAVGDALHVDYAEGNNDLHPTSAAAQPVIAVAHVALADNEYGWVVSAGVVSVKAATVAQGASLVTTGTAGTLDDTAASAANALGSASGVGVWSLSADSGGLATVRLS